MRNWYNFIWLCGDHIVEQHVHNLDVINWAMKPIPSRRSAWAAARRTDPDYGHIFDLFAIDYEYPQGVHVISMCRQIDNCASSVSEAVGRHQGHQPGATPTGSTASRCSPAQRQTTLPTCRSTPT